MPQFRSRIPTGWLTAICAVVAVVMSVRLFANEDAVIVPPPAIDNPKAAGPLQKAVFAGGCFWGVQGVFQHVRGVRNAESGYAGGSKLTAHYEIVGMGATDHAESVEVTFDPNEITYGQLLQVFFSVIHDPTQLNRQGPDSGSQYRSAIFYADEQQKKIANAYIAQLDTAHVYPRAIVTKVDPLKGFYPAEEYHQDFLTRNPNHPYIVYNDLPKLKNFRSVFPAIYTSNPALVAKLSK